MLDGDWSSDVCSSDLHGMADLTAITVASDANNSEMAVESQNVAIVRMATRPASGWMILGIVIPL
jgi:hypothetical protein